MGYYLLKIALTTALIVSVSEIAKRSTMAGAVLASVPLVSVVAMFWLYLETQDAVRVSALASSVFWLVLPSLALFITLPLLLKHGIDFYLSMGIAITITVMCYFLMVALLNYLGIKL